VHGVCRLNDTKGEATTEAVAEIIENDPLWKLVFPNVIPDKNKGWGAEGYEVRDTNYDDGEWARIITKRPVCAGTFVGRGWKSGSWIGDRFDGTFIIDDLHDEKNTKSEREMQAIFDFYENTLDYCIMDIALEIWNYTPWLTTDLYAFVESTGEYILSDTPVMKPAEPNAEGALFWEPTPLHRDYPDLGNIPLSGRWWYLYWPEVWGFDRLAKKYRKTGPIKFALQMLLDLEATKGINLKREWLHEYPAADIGHSWPVYIGVDYASTADKLKNKDRDYFALSIGRAIPGGGLVVIDGYRGHLSKGEALQKVQSICAVYPHVHLIGVENIGKGEEFYNDLVLMDDIYGNPLPLLAVSHGRKSKGDRFENWLGPRFQMGRVWITDTPTPFIQEFINEWLTWPNAQHDDCIDAVYMMCVAGEGALPGTAERSGRVVHSTIKTPNPYKALAGA
jgi:phage terminase large subunit-like protein